MNRSPSITLSKKLRLVFDVRFAWRSGDPPRPYHVSGVPSSPLRTPTPKRRSEIGAFGVRRSKRNERDCNQKAGHTVVISSWAHHPAQTEQNLLETSSSPSSRSVVSMSLPTMSGDGRRVRPPQPEEHHQRCQVRLAPLRRELRALRTVWWTVRFGEAPAGRVSGRRPERSQRRSGSVQTKMFSSWAK